MKKRQLHSILTAALAGCIGLTTVPAQAENWADRISISGFASAIYQGTDEEVHFNGEASESGINEDGSFQGTKIGLGIRADITDRMSFASQFLSEDSEGYSTHVDWAFAAIKLTDDFTFRAGKIKYPVGLVNEYQAVGYAMPWLITPEVIYSELATENAMATTRTAPGVTRESYTGASLYWNKTVGDWAWDVNLFGGSVALESSDVKKLRGITVNLDWNDTVQFTASTYTGVMRNVPAFVADEDTGLPVANSMTAMNGKEHSVDLFGAKADWNNFVFYTEFATINMETIKAMSADAWYITVGYHFGKWLPHYTYQSYENDTKSNAAQYTQYNISALGLRYELMRNTALKFDIAQIDHENGAGLFNAVPNDAGKIMKFGIGLDYIF
jgi:hypothetical protein